jgi:hypothetical protein
MRNAILGAVLIASLWMVAAGMDRLSAAGPVPGVAGRELITMSTPIAGDKGQMLTIVDPQLKTICVYHVDAASGAIALKSVRNIHWDLQMGVYNGVNPLPSELSSMAGQR